LGDFDTLLHVHSLGHPDVHVVLRELRKVLDQYSADRPRFSVGEIHVFDWPAWASYYGPALDELHMPFNFGLLAAPWTAPGVRGLVEAIEQAVPPGAWPNYVLGNHDEHRVATRLGETMAPLAMMLLLTLRGTPTLYYGDELGMRDGEIPPDRERDPFGLRVPGLGLGRDPCRTPMQWDAGPNAGFCSPGVEPWLPVAADAPARNVAGQLPQPRSILNLTRQLIRLRRAYPALALGDYRTLNGGSDGCYVFTREFSTEDGGDRMLVALNFDDQEQAVALPDLGQATLLLSTRLDRQGRISLSSLPLRGQEGCVIRLDGAGRSGWGPSHLRLENPGRESNSRALR
jgi:alpha-glucosidase